MQSWEDKRAAMLRDQFPGWDIWWIRSVYPKPDSTWHARPKGHPAALVDAASPDELARGILAMTR